MLVSLQDPYKPKNLLRTNPNPATRDMMTKNHYVQAGNGHFNAGAQKTEGISLGVKVTGGSRSGYREIIMRLVKDIGGGFNAVGVVTFPRQLEQSFP